MAADAVSIPELVDAHQVGEGGVHGGGVRIQPVPPDPDSLARIAETSSGRFFQAPTSENLTAVYDSLGSRIGFRIEEREVTVAFAAAGLLLLAAAGALRARRGARLP